MKARAKHFLLFVPFAAAMGWATFVFSAEPEQSAISPAEEMDQRIEEIVSRVGMSAPLEAPLPGEADFAAEKLEEGWIIEATLEEVETALQAARNTPSAEDDIAAMAFGSPQETLKAYQIDTAFSSDAAVRFAIQKESLDGKSIICYSADKENTVLSHRLEPKTRDWPVDTVTAAPLPGGKTQLLSEGGVVTKIEVWRNGAWEVEPFN